MQVFVLIPGDHKSIRLFTDENQARRADGESHTNSILKVYEVKGRETSMITVEQTLNFARDILADINEHQNRL